MSDKINNSDFYLRWVTEELPRLAMRATLREINGITEQVLEELKSENSDIPQEIMLALVFVSFGCERFAVTNWLMAYYLPSERVKKVLDYVFGPEEIAAMADQWGDET